ncbi:MAG: hypothetical protein DMG08_27075 [Acidobacteria bacterium]|nr:MAG: hypothetical protein DMG08_27075 [Acidobacteriota bacterium]
MRPAERGAFDTQSFPRDAPVHQGGSKLPHSKRRLGARRTLTPTFHCTHNRIEGRVDSGEGICVSSGFCRRISIMDWKELEKMTIVKIREEALKHEIKSVHGKSKAQLMDELASVLVIEKPHVHFAEKVVHSKGELKHKIRELKGERHKAIAAHDHKALHDIRRQIHKMKRQIKKIETKAAAKTSA